MKPTNKKEEVKPAFIDPIEKTEDELKGVLEFDDAVLKVKHEPKKPRENKVKVATGAIYTRPEPMQEAEPNGVVHQDDVFVILEEKDGFGKLKSGAGWISLQYTKRV